MDGNITRKRVPTIFFRTESGGEPIREWLKNLAKKDRQMIGEDLKTVAHGWPIGRPVCRLMEQGLFEVRTTLDHNRMLRVLFYTDKNGRMLLHGFERKSRKTPDAHLAVARKNKAKHERGLK